MVTGSLCELLIQFQIKAFQQNARLYGFRLLPGKQLAPQPRILFLKVYSGGGEPIGAWTVPPRRQQPCPEQQTVNKPGDILLESAIERGNRREYMLDGSNGVGSPMQTPTL
jgi:hypothetical protein